MRLTQRQINLLLLGLMTIGASAEFILFARQDGLGATTLGFGIGAVVTGGALAAYARGWDRARYVVVVAACVLVGSVLEGDFLTTRIAMEILLPTVIALIVAGPLWVLAASATMIATIAARTGGQSTYLMLDNLIIYGLLVGGMVLSRLAVDTAQQLAAANAHADAARREAESRAQELAQRNDELQQLVNENAQQRDLIYRLSVPILPLTDSTLMLPLVGALDSARLRHAQQQVLQAVHAAGARLLIIDVTGVPLIDTHVGNGLLAMVSAVRLLGASVAIVGIHSNIAQTIVGLGIDLDSVIIFRDVRSVLEHHWHVATARNGGLVHSLMSS